MKSHDAYDPYDAYDADGSLGRTSANPIQTVDTETDLVGNVDSEQTGEQIIIDQPAMPRDNEGKARPKEKEPNFVPAQSTKVVDLVEVCPSFEYVNKLRANELNMMNPSERDDISDEVHGVSNVENENPEAMNQALVEFQFAIDRVSTKKAYNLAKLMNKAYVADRHRRLMALRADRFDVFRAARRLVDHFELKQELFGIDNLVRPITLSRLNETDREFLNSGFFQVLQKKDNSGRPIVVLVQYYDGGGSSKDTKLRVAWYLMMKVSEGNDDIQRRGFVCIIYNVGVSLVARDDPQEIMQMTSKFFASILAKYASFHYCYDNIKLLPVLSQIQMSLNKALRLRFRHHYGSHKDCQLALRSFGIQAAAMCINHDGLLQTADHLEWVSGELAVEDAETDNMIASSDIIYPTRHDVLLGRGKGFTTFPGNKCLMAIIAEKRLLYLTVRKGVKTQYAEEVVRHIQVDIGGRFLRRKESSPDNWEEVSDSIARDKVAHSFRRTHGHTST